MLDQILLFLIKTLASLYITILLARFLLQTVRADFYNPISQFIVKATNPVLLPLRKVIPGFFGIDFACIVAALIFEWLCVLILLLLLSSLGLSSELAVTTLLVSVLGLIGMVLNIYLFGIFILVIISWVAPHNHNPAVSLVSSIVNPVMAPIKRIMPNTGGFDLSPMVAIILIYVLKIVLANVALEFGELVRITPGL